MDFDHTQDEEDFNDHVRQVIKNRINPHHSEWRKGMTTPHSFFKILGEEGLLGFRFEDDMVVPIPWLMNMHYYKQMAQYSGGLAIASFASTQVGIQALHYYGTPGQKEAYLYPGIRGERIFSFANTEPGAGSDASAIETSAVDMGDHYLVNGAKAYITNGDIADHIVLTAVTHPDEEKNYRGISMFIVDGNTPGLTRSRLKKLGWKLSHLSMLRFNDVKVPKENLIGEEKRGFYQTMNVFNTSRIGISALALGTAIGAYRLAYRNALDRKVFGKSLLEHESKRNEFADNLAILHAGWLLAQKAAFLKDQGREFRYNSAMAKLFCTEEGLKIARWANETFGARGVIESLPITQFTLDAKAATLGEGAPEVQKKIVAGHIEELLDEL
jgi:alkylation response protein AidB-like acyl-CoA dehydrogenase